MAGSGHKHRYRFHRPPNLLSIGSPGAGPGRVEHRRHRRAATLVQKHGTSSTCLAAAGVSETGAAGPRRQCRFPLPVHSPRAACCPVGLVGKEKGKKRYTNGPICTSGWVRVPPACRLWRMLNGHRPGCVAGVSRAWGLDFNFFPC